MNDLLTVTEIYKSIQGESVYTGWPCVFVRLAGCPLRCRWCDTVYSFKGGDSLSIEEVIAQVKAQNCNMVELTGGEPLAQQGTIALVEKLVDAGHKVLIETGGGELIAGLHPGCHIIMDLKPPGSGMTDKMLWENIEHLKATDEIKFVVASREDFDWTVGVIKERALETVCQLSVSPAFGLVKADELVDWQLETGLNLRLNLQIHKFIWHPRKKGV